MWFTKEERMGILIISFSVLIGSFVLNRREERAINVIAAMDNDIRESVTGAEIDSLSSKVDVNSASFEELLSVPGIGPKIAESIIERRKIRKFKDIYELKEVKGVGDKKIESIKRYIEVK